MGYIRRSLEPIVEAAAADFPVVVLTGPRQSGKTTLLKHLFAANWRYVSLEPPDVRAAAEADPRGFLALNPPPVIFDEVHCAPGLLPYVKEIVDSDRDRTGRFILTGSQNLLLTEGVTESLAGRAAIMRLLPLSRREADGTQNAPLPWENGRARLTGTHASGLWLWEGFLRGGYPELAANPTRDASLWHSSYVQTYLERDVRSVRSIGDLTQFQVFLRALAARSGQLLNRTELGRDLGLTANTVKAWLSVLEATHQIVVLRPYFANVGKRLVKTPKVYFADVGTLCHLVGLRDAEHAMASPMAGAIMETVVLAEVVRTITHQGRQPEVYFWRTADGSEVDLLLAESGRLIPIEVKLSATPNARMAKGISAFRRLMGAPASKGYVVHPGSVCLPLGPDAVALPFADL